jgi:hypothetical protein
MPDQSTKRWRKRDQDVAEGDLVEQMTSASFGDEEDDVARIDTHEGMVDEADLLEQAEAVEDDEDYPRDG